MSQRNRRASLPPIPALPEDLEDSQIRRRPAALDDFLYLGTPAPEPRTRRPLTSDAEAEEAA